MSNARRWIASWVATGLVVTQIVLLVALGGGEIAWLRYVGFALWALAAVFGWLPVYQFKRHGGVAEGASYVHTTRLVDSGLYAVVRHPQFVAWPIMSIAVSLVSQHPAVIALCPPAIALAALDFRKVDQRNIEKFGDAYREYIQRVPGWNPVAGIWRLLRRGR